MSLSIPETGKGAQSFGDIVYGAILVALVVMAASLFGILTRPVGFLAAFWPANAILLGMMVRNPGLPSVWSWIGAFAGYIAADMAVGGAFGITLWLTAANLGGAMTGVLLYRLLPDEDRRLRRPLSVLYLFAICACAALVAAVIGGGAARMLFGRDFLTGLEFWFVTELVNGLVILPAILTFPGWLALKRSARKGFGERLPTLIRAAPLLALAASVLVGVLVGGPGALVFSVPALLWCALSYSMFVTALLTMALCGWLLIGISTGAINMMLPQDLLESSTSVRLGVALIALGPLTVASINSARGELLTKLAHAADHDCLTGTLARGAFLRQGSRVVEDVSRGSRHVAVLMLDIDHFKQVNDRMGHAFGDRVLDEFSRLVAASLRPGDLIGRLGGEEFAVVLPHASAQDGLRVAERIRSSVAERPVIDADGRSLAVTVSIGIAASAGRDADLPLLLSEADRALYRAKELGRNRVFLEAA